MIYYKRSYDTIIEFGFHIIWRIMQISESVIRPGFHADLHNCWAYTKAMFTNNLGVIKKRKFFKDKMISFMNILKRFNFFLVLTQLLASL